MEKCLFILQNKLFVKKFCVCGFFAAKADPEVWLTMYGAASLSREVSLSNQVAGSFVSNFKTVRASLFGQFTMRASLDMKPRFNLV